MTCARMVRQNLAQTLAAQWLPFVIYICYETMSNMCLIEKSSRLRDDVTLGRPLL
jgi:hypothetical protein